MTEVTLFGGNIAPKGDLVPIKKGSNIMFVSGELYKDSIKESTRQNYIKKLLLLEKRGFPMPCTEYQLRMLVEEMATDLSYSTVNGYVSAVKWYHDQNDYRDPDFTGTVAKTLKNMKRKKKEAGESVEQALPLLTEDVNNAVDYYDSHPSAMHRRNKALLLLMYYGALRRSEATQLNLGNLHFRSDGLELDLKDTKNDKDKVFIERFGDKEFDSVCPVVVLETYIQDYLIDKRHNDPVFYTCHSSGLHFKDARLNDNAVSDILKYTMDKLGSVQASRYKGHSPRRGYVTDAVKSDAHIIEIQKNARMSLYTVQLYADVAEAKATKPLIERMKELRKNRHPNES